MYIGLHVKYPLFLSDFNQTKLFDRFSKNTKILLHENASVGAQLFRVDGQTDEYEEATSCLFVILRPCTKNHSPAGILLR